LSQLSPLYLLALYEAGSSLAWLAAPSPGYAQLLRRHHATCALKTPLCLPGWLPAQKQTSAYRAWRRSLAGWRLYGMKIAAIVAQKCRLGSRRITYL